MTLYNKKIVKIITFYEDGTFSESVPYTSPMPSIPPTPFQSTSICTKCGLKLDKVMGYVCSMPDCPTGLGPIMCNAGTS